MTGIEVGYAITGLITGAASMYAYKCDCDKKLFKKMHGSGSQITKLRDYLESGKEVNTKIAKDELGINSLGTLLHRLRSEGMNIETLKTAGKKAANYKMVK